MYETSIKQRMVDGVTCKDALRTNTVSLTKLMWYYKEGNKRDLAVSRDKFFFKRNDSKSW